MRRGHVRHAATEAKPARQREDQRFRGVQRTKIHLHGIGLGQAAKLRNSQSDRRHKLTIRLPQFRCDIQAVAAHRSLNQLRRLQRHQLVRRKWFARQQLAGGDNNRPSRMIHHHQLGLIKVKHFAQFLRNLQLVVSVVRRELRLATNPDILVRIGLDQTRFGQRQPERRRTEDVGDESELSSVPSVEVRT